MCLKALGGKERALGLVSTCEEVRGGMRGGGAVGRETRGLVRDSC